MLVVRARRLRVAVAVVAALALSIVATAGPALAAGRHASLVIDVNSGRILHANAADEPRFPASLAKIMTLYLVFELLEQGKLTMATRVHVSATAASQAPSRLGLEPGSEITVAEVIRALIVKSANDMAVAIAEHIAGSEERFAELMTAKARQLGMAGTTFRNASGLPDQSQVTTARDMATLALKLMDNFPRYYPLFATPVFAYGGAIHRNHNTLLGTFAGTDGIKTGYTSASGFNLVASVRRDGRHVVGVYFGGQTASVRNAHMKVLLTRALARASTERTRRVLVAEARRPVHQVPKSKAAAAPAVPAPVAAVRPPVARTVWAAPGAAPAPVAPHIAIAKVRPVAVAPAEASKDGAAPVAIARVKRIAIVPRGTQLAVAPQQAPAHQPQAVQQPLAGGVLGAQPSTLAAQAARINQGQAPVVVASNAPNGAVPMPPPSYLKGAASGHVSVQVGAYSSETEAHRQLQIVQTRAGALLAGREATAQAAAVGNRHVYRARFVGFDAQSAATACTELRRLQIDCMVARAE